MLHLYFLWIVINAIIYSLPGQDFYNSRLLWVCFGCFVNSQNHLNSSTFIEYSCLHHHSTFHQMFPIGLGLKSLR
jgi:hypothetical protein